MDFYCTGNPSFLIVFSTSLRIRTRVAGPLNAGQSFTIQEVHDRYSPLSWFETFFLIRAQIFLDGKYIGLLARYNTSLTVQLPEIPKDGGRLDILVENMGNFLRNILENSIQMNW
jgi:hypothetical protein